MIKLNVKEFNIFLRLLEDEVERYKMWIVNRDFVGEQELRSLEEELKNLSSTLEEMKLKKERLLTLLR